jgi:acetyl esterase/lipase
VFDIPYGPDPHQCLDLFVPDRPTGAPLVLFIHGGAWSVGDKSQYEAVGEQLAREGLVTALANHRLSPAVQHPAHAQDVARAVAWFYRHAASYGGDLEQLYLMGHSSGAHLASLLALDATYLAAEGLEASAIHGVVGIAGAGYDLDASYASTVVAPFVRPVFGPDCSRWALAAPLRYVQARAAPFLLIHGLRDTETPPASTQVFAAALRSAGVATQLHLLPDENHISVMFAAAPLVLGFLQAPWSVAHSRT